MRCGQGNRYLFNTIELFQIAPQPFNRFDNERNMP